MPLLILKILLALLLFHTLLKFAFFFVLPYSTRRKMLDKSYGDTASATKKSDYALLGIALIPVLLLYLSGQTDYLSFAVGLYLGMTLIQVYFHSFSEPLPPDKAPQAPVSPIKMMSYAIQENPTRPWPELAIISVFVLWILYELATKGFGLF
jgi:hypothetical protein